MAVIGFEFGLGQVIELEAFAGFGQTGSVGLVGNLARVEEVDPLVYGHYRPFVEVVYAQDVVLRIELTDRIYPESLLLEGGEVEQLVVMQSAELGFAMIDVVASAAQSEIDNVDAEYLAYILVAFTTVDVFRHELGGAEQHALEVGIFVVVLYLKQDESPLAVFGQQVHTVVLVKLAFLVAFALQQLDDRDFFVEQRGH